MKKSKRKKIITIIVCAAVLTLLLYGVFLFFLNSVQNTANYIILVNRNGVGDREEWTSSFISYDNAKEMLFVDEEYANIDYIQQGKHIPVRLHFNSFAEIEITWKVIYAVKDWRTSAVIDKYSGVLETTCRFFDGKWHVIDVENTRIDS